MKEGARILAVDDAPFDREMDAQTSLVGLLFRRMVLERARRDVVTIDGDDSLPVIGHLFFETREEARLIMLHGTTVAGFNVIDVGGLHSATGVPVAAFLEEMPDEEKVFRALRRLGYDEKIGIVRSNPPYERFLTKKGPIYCSYIGMAGEEVANLVRRWSIESRLPEQLRVADVVASLFEGEGLL